MITGIRGRRLAGSRRPPLFVAVAFALLVLSLHTVSFAQPAFQTKQPFVAGLIEFVEAAAGTYGDEGSRLTAALAAMDAGLARWNVALSAYRTGIAAQLEGAAPATAASMRLALCHPDAT